MAITIFIINLQGWKSKNSFRSAAIKYFYGNSLSILYLPLVFSIVDREVSKTNSLTNFCVNNWVRLFYSKSRQKLPNNTLITSYLLTNDSFKRFSVSKNLFLLLCPVFFSLSPIFLFKLTQDCTLHDINLWQKEILKTIKVYEIVYIVIYTNTYKHTQTPTHPHTDAHTHTHRYIYIHVDK